MAESALVTSIPPEITNALFTLAGVALTAGVTLLAALVQHKGKPENALIDQLQQEMATMRRRVEGLEARDRVYLPHILRLNRHIDEGLGPPAPPLPRVLQEFLSSADDLDN